MRTGRTLVNHVGSLPRPPTSSDLPNRQEAGEAVDTAKLTGQVEIATAHVIGKQVEAGVDVGNDVEQIADLISDLGSPVPVRLWWRSVRRHGFTSTSQVMRVRRNCVFRTPPQRRTPQPRSLTWRRLRS